MSTSDYLRGRTDGEYGARIAERNRAMADYAETYALNQQVSNYANAYNQLLSQYNSLVGKYNYLLDEKNTWQEYAEGIKEAKGHGDNAYATLKKALELSELETANAERGWYASKRAWFTTSLETNFLARLPDLAFAREGGDQQKKLFQQITEEIEKLRNAPGDTEENFKVAVQFITDAGRRIADSAVFREFWRNELQLLQMSADTPQIKEAVQQRLWWRQYWLDRAKNSFPLIQWADRPEALRKLFLEHMAITNGLLALRFTEVFHRNLMNQFLYALNLHMIQGKDAGFRESKTPVWGNMDGKVAWSPYTDALQMSLDTLPFAVFPDDMKRFFAETAQGLTRDTAAQMDGSLQAMDELYEWRMGQHPESSPMAAEEPDDPQGSQGSRKVANGSGVWDGIPPRNPVSRQQPAPAKAVDWVTPQVGTPQVANNAGTGNTGTSNASASASQVVTQGVSAPAQAAPQTTPKQSTWLSGPK